MIGFFMVSGMALKGQSMSISDYPERISISPTYRQKREDDFYLVDRKAFPGKGTEYVRADRIEELEAKLLARDGELKAKAQIIEELEAQNELLQQMIASLPPPHPDNTLRNRLVQRRATLAKLKGETDD